MPATFAEDLVAARQALRLPISPKPLHAQGVEIVSLCTPHPRRRHIAAGGEDAMCGLPRRFRAAGPGETRQLCEACVSVSRSLS